MNAEARVFLEEIQRHIIERGEPDSYSGTPHSTIDYVASLVDRAECASLPPRLREHLALLARMNLRAVGLQRLSLSFDLVPAFYRAIQEILESAAHPSREDVSTEARAHRPGPALLATRADCLKVKARLEAAGQPAGYKSIAQELGIHATTVRRRLAGH